MQFETNDGVRAKGKSKEQNTVPWFVGRGLAFKMDL